MKFIAYERTFDSCRTLHRGSFGECASYVSANPKGPRGGMTHVRAVK